MPLEENKERPIRSHATCSYWASSVVFASGRRLHTTRLSGWRQPLGEGRRKTARLRVNRKGTGSGERAVALGGCQQAAMDGWRSSQMDASPPPPETTKTTTMSQRKQDGHHKHLYDPNSWTRLAFDAVAGAVCGFSPDRRTPADQLNPTRAFIVVASFNKRYASRRGRDALPGKRTAPLPR